MQVFWQYDNRFGAKRMVALYSPISLTQNIDPIHQNMVCFPLRQVDRKEIRPSRNSRSNVAAHARKHDAPSIACMSENIDT